MDKPRIAMSSNFYGHCQLPAVHFLLCDICCSLSEDTSRSMVRFCVIRNSQLELKWILE